MNAQSTIKAHYPTKAKVRSAAEALHELRIGGLDVAAIEVSPDGTIRILSSAAFPSRPRDEYEQWEQAGKL